MRREAMEEKSQQIKKRDGIRSGYRLFGPLFDTIELGTALNLPKR